MWLRKMNKKSIQNTARLGLAAILLASLGSSGCTSLQKKDNVCYNVQYVRDDAGRITKEIYKTKDGEIYRIKEHAYPDIE